MIDEDKVREYISLFYIGDDRAWDKGVLSLSALGKNVVPHILHLVDDENSFARAGAAEVFGNIKYAEAIPMLLKMLGDNEWLVRVKAAASLGKLGDACAASPVAALFMRETHPWVRVSAVKALGQICDPSTIPTLCHALADSNPEVIKEASLNLEGMAPRDEKDLLLLRQGTSRLLAPKEICTSTKINLEKCAEKLRRTSRVWAKMLQAARKESEEERGRRGFRGRRRGREKRHGRKEILGELGDRRPLKIRL